MCRCVSTGEAGASMARLAHLRPVKSMKLNELSGCKQESVYSSRIMHTSTADQWPTTVFSVTAVLTAIVGGSMCLPKMLRSPFKCSAIKVSWSRASFVHTNAIHLRPIPARRFSTVGVLCSSTVTGSKQRFYSMFMR